MEVNIDQLDRMDTITTCLEAVSDLYGSGQDLHAVNRDNQALLLAFLLQEYNLARKQLTN